MALVRYTVPSDIPAYTGWSFPMYPGTFDFFAGAFVEVVERHVAYLAERRDRDPRAAIEYPRARAAVSTLAEAIVADALIEWRASDPDVWWLIESLVYGRQFAKVNCSVCRRDYLPEEGGIEEWSEGGGLAAEGGRRYVCPVGHTLFAIMEWNS